MVSIHDIAEGRERNLFRPDGDRQQAKGDAF
jgi:hypothetical protein